MISRTLPPPIIPSIRSCVDFKNPIITLNTGQTSNNTSLVSGLYINRTPNPDARLVWSERDLSFRAGTVGNMANITTVTDNSSPGFLKWDGSHFTSNGAENINAINQNLSTTSSPVFQDVTMNAIIVNGTRFVLPTTQGAPGTVLVNDGQGQLSWQHIDASSTIPTRIQDNLNTTSVATDTTAGEITTRAGNNIVQRLNASHANFLVPIISSSSFNLKNTIITTSYVTQPDDTMVVFTGDTDCDVTLPNIVYRESRLLIFENASQKIFTIQPASDDKIDGNSSPLVLDSEDASAVLFSDGLNNWIII
jgi:hypothetical protein